MTVLDDLWQEVDATVKTEGFKIEILDGKVVMSPQSPEQDWTTDDIKAAAQRSGIARERLVRDVAVDFPGETSSAPDVAVLDEGAHRVKNRYTCVDLLAAFEVVSTEDDENDYVVKVAKYARYGIGVYVIADPFRGICTILTGPGPSGYGEREVLTYGDTISVTLSTGETFTVDTSTFPKK